MPGFVSLLYTRIATTLLGSKMSTLSNPPSSPRASRASSKASRAVRDSPIMDGKIAFIEGGLAHDDLPPISHIIPWMYA